VLINISGGHDLTLHEVAEAARIISDAVDPDANIISGMVIDPTLDEAMKVTVIATGFDRAGEDRPRPPMPQININRPTPAPSLASLPINDRERQDRAERDREEEKPTADVPFYRKVIANVRGDDPKRLRAELVERGRLRHPDGVEEADGLSREPRVVPSRSIDDLVASSRACAGGVDAFNEQASLTNTVLSALPGVGRERCAGAWLIVVVNRDLVA
jgi:hypothetical protein